MFSNLFLQLAVSSDIIRLLQKVKGNFTMTKAPVAPVVLVILDGWGYCEDKRGNAIAA
ncbi:MAG: 2,3-bisphosphoglycerate-independent phosphoglycerate mutase, partial [Sphaerospermopsis kisseleviana]